MLNYMEIGLVSYLRARFKKKPPAQKPQVVEVYDDSPDVQAAPEPVNLEQGFPNVVQTTPNVDFDHNGDLESYVRGLNVPRDVIEQWMSTGLLFPDEMKTAEKMIQIMRRHEKDER